MNSGKQLNCILALLWAIVILFISCGLSKEELEQSQKDRLNQVNGSIIDSSKVVYYNASSFNLPAGIVYALTPSPEAVRGGAKGLYIHIKHEDNSISVHPIDYPTYLNLNVGDVLK